MTEPQPSFLEVGNIIYTPHPCAQPNAENYPVGTIWECGKCRDHWEIQSIGDHPHWVRIRRVKYEMSSK